MKDKIKNMDIIEMALVAFMILMGSVFVFACYLDYMELQTKQELVDIARLALSSQ